MSATTPMDDASWLCENAGTNDDVVAFLRPIEKRDCPDIEPGSQWALGTAFLGDLWLEAIPFQPPPDYFGYFALNATTAKTLLLAARFAQRGDDFMTALSRAVGPIHLPAEGTV